MAKRPAKKTLPKRKSKKPATTTASLEADLPELQQARALWQMQRFSEALELFDRAVQQHPNHLVALVDASRAFGARYEVARAEQLLDRVMELAKNRPQVLHLAGQSYRMIFRPEKALACFQRAAAADTRLTDTQLELALLYERRGRLEEGLTCVAQCLQVRPDYWEAKLVQARLLRRQGELTQAERLMRQVIQTPQLHEITRSQAWADLANLLDQQQAYQEAFEAMLQSKAVLREQEGPFWAKAVQESQRFEELSSSLTPEHFQRWAKQAPDLQGTDLQGPDLQGQEAAQKLALLTGPPRSGTTLMEKVLDAHPHVVSSDEHNAFPTYIVPRLLAHTKAFSAEAFDTIPLEVLQAERRRYLRFMSDALGEPIGERLHLDKNPSIVRLIPGFLRLFPECRLLIALRDPRDVVLSCFLCYFPLNTTSVQFRTLERAADRYCQEMQAWLQLREMLPSGWQEIRYETYVEDFQSEARRNLAFLDLPWDDSVAAYRDQIPQKQVNSPTYASVAKPIYRSAMGRWKNYQRQMEPVLSKLEPFLESFGYR